MNLSDCSRLASALGRQHATRPVLSAALLFVSWPASSFAQSGVPGARLDSGRDHRARVRAEAYGSVARFFSRWREAWNNDDVNALARLYTDDATARFPGQQVVRGREPLLGALANAVEGSTDLSTLDMDFDSDGEDAVVVSRYFLLREGRRTEGVMTTLLYSYRSSWRVRVQVFDAPEVVPDSAPDYPR